MRVVEGRRDTDQPHKAMERLASSFKTWEEDNKVDFGAVVNGEHAKIIAEQMDVPLEDAEDALRRNEGDLNKALVYLINQ